MITKPLNPRYNAQKPYENVQSGYYIVGDRKMFFRSKMEANFALYLEFLKVKGEIISWEYEPITFVFEKILFGTRSYKPDFRITKPNGAVEYFECKGYFDKKSRTKLKRMKIYYPNVKVSVIGKAEYRALAKWQKLLKWY